MNKKEKIKNYINNPPAIRILSFYSLLLLTVFSIGFFLRFYKLTAIPPGLIRDEASIGYNAYSILKTGRDEHGRKLPLYFEALGDHKLPVIIYSTAVSVAFFGLNEFAVRFPSALLGSLTVILSYLIVKKGLVFENKKGPSQRFGEKENWLPLLTAFILAINPWHIYYSRGAFEMIYGLFFISLGVYFLLLTKKRTYCFPLSLISFGLAFYCYSLTRLLAPLLFIFFLLILRTKPLLFSKKIIGLSGIISILFLMPFITAFSASGGLQAAYPTLIMTSPQVKANIISFRSFVLESPLKFFGPIFFNKLMILGYEYLKNLVTSLSPAFYFVSGSLFAGNGLTGQFYLIEILPLVFGLIYTVKQVKIKSLLFFIITGWVIITLAVAALTINPPYGSRSLFMVLPLSVIIASGWLYLFGLTKKNIKKLLLLAVTLVYIWHFNYFIIAYFVRFPLYFAREWSAKNKELVQFLTPLEEKQDFIIMTKPEKSFYIYLLFYQKVPPKWVWDNIERYPPDSEGWQFVKRLGKYQFRPIDWSRDTTPINSSILISEGNEYSDRQVVDKEIYYPQTTQVVADGENILSYPDKKAAFRIWKYKGLLNK